MLELIGADVLRDGGSISLTYRRDDALVSVVLEVNRYEESEPRTFGHLHIGSEIPNGCDTATIVAKASEQEASLIADLQKLRHCKPTGRQSNTHHWLEKLEAFLPGRTG